MPDTTGGRPTTGGPVATGVAAATPTLADGPVDHRAARTVYAVTARRATRSGLLWGAVFGLVVVESAAGYAGSFPTEAARRNLAGAYEHNLGLAALLGPARALDTVAGYTAWHAMGILGVLGAIWALLLATRLTRGEEDAGRWELLLSGQTTRRRATIGAIAGTVTGLGVAWAVTALATIAVGRGPEVRFTVAAAVYLATSVIAAAMMFAAVGVLAAQLAASRRQANAIGAAVLGGAYLLRMVADSGAGLGWLRWVSPLGWCEQLHPLTTPRPLALLPVAGFVLALATLAAILAGRRDAGASTLPRRDVAAPRIRLLTGAFGLTVRLTRPAWLGWLAAMAVGGLVFGLVSEAGARALTGSRAVEGAIGRLGGRYGGAAAYLGVTFLLAAALIAFAAVTQLAATRGEEAGGYLDHLLARPVARWRWLAGRLAAAAALVIAAGVTVGAATWVGAASQHAGLSPGRLLAAGLNTAAPALFILGAGTLIYGLRPRLAAPAAYALVGWSLLVHLLSSGVRLNHWIVNTSVLSHITPAPAADPNWTAVAWLAGLAILAASTGILAFGRRDLTGA